MAPAVITTNSPMAICSIPWLQSPPVFLTFYHHPDLCHEPQIYTTTSWAFLPGCAAATSTQHVRCVSPLSLSSKLPLLLFPSASRTTWSLQSETSDHSRLLLVPLSIDVFCRQVISTLRPLISLKTLSIPTGTTINRSSSLAWSLVFSLAPCLQSNSSYATHTLTRRR